MAMDEAYKKAIQRFGYIISALFMLATGVGVLLRWVYSPLVFLLTMYLLTGSLWAPQLIRPLYDRFGRKWIPPGLGDEKKSVDDSLFHDN